MSELLSIVPINGACSRKAVTDVGQLLAIPATDEHSDVLVFVKTGGDDVHIQFDSTGTLDPATILTFSGGDDDRDWVITAGVQYRFDTLGFTHIGLRCATAETATVVIEGHRGKKMRTRSE